MKKTITLQSESRGENDKKSKHLREEGYLPAVVYGSGSECRSLRIKYQDFERTYGATGDTSLIDLIVDGKPDGKVLVKDVQRDIIKDEPIHVDLYRVDMNKGVTAAIPLNFIEESAAVKELGGILVKVRDAVEVECLPGDLIDRIDVDLSVLKEMDDAIRASDLVIPDNVTRLIADDEVIANIQAPRIEEEPSEQEGKEAAEGEEREGDAKDETGKDGDGEEAKKAE